MYVTGWLQSSPAEDSKRQQYYCKNVLGGRFLGWNWKWCCYCSSGLALLRAIPDIFSGVAGFYDVSWASSKKSSRFGKIMHGL